MGSRAPWPDFPPDRPFAAILWDTEVGLKDVMMWQCNQASSSAATPARPVASAKADPTAADAPLAAGGGGAPAGVSAGVAAPGKDSDRTL